MKDVCECDKKKQNITTVTAKNLLLYFFDLLSAFRGYFSMHEEQDEQQMSLWKCAGQLSNDELSDPSEPDAAQQSR